MHIIDDRLFEEVQKKYKYHRLVIAFVEVESVYKGEISHKEAVVCAMTSSYAFNPYRELPNLNLKTDLMECESVSVSSFFKMCKVKIAIISNKCRSGYCKIGDEYIVEDLCPPICHELWNGIYPMVYALLNGASLDYGNERAKCFDAKVLMKEELSFMPR